MRNFYITTPIYYVNDVPHIGHAYTSVLSDIIARFKKLDGYNVKFLTGTDEHGQKVAASAKKLGISSQEICDKNHVFFKNLSSYLNLSNDDFIRTTENRHKISVEKLWKKLEKNGYIYLDKYKGWYSVRDEAFYSSDEIYEDSSGQKLGPTGAPVEWLEEESYFFALSKFEDKLLEFYENNPNFILPKSRKNEVVSFVKNGLKDLSISRTSFDWGIKVPGNEKHVIYVWLDALTNYISAIDYFENLEDKNSFWPANIHMVGKDILRFHAIYWPAFLMAADIALPTQIFAHGWWTNEGQKISKSLGNVINPKDIVENFGCDYTRYCLAREVIIGNDGNYSHESFKQRINSELSNKIGNLQQRVLSFIAKNLEGKILEKIDFDNLYNKEIILQNSEKIILESREFMNSYELNSILDLIISLANDANIFIDREAPWTLRKNDIKRMNEVLCILLEILRYLGILLQPFIPDLSCKMLDQLQIPDNKRSFANLDRKNKIDITNISFEIPTPIFPKIEEKK